MCPYKSLFVLTNSNGFLWALHVFFVPMYFNGSLWVLKGPYSSLLILIGPYGSL